METFLNVLKPQFSTKLSHESWEWLFSSSSFNIFYSTCTLWMRKKQIKPRREKNRVQIKYFTVICNDLDTFLINLIAGHNTHNLETFRKVCPWFAKGRGEHEPKMDFKILYDLDCLTLKLGSRSIQVQVFYPVHLYVNYKPDRAKGGFYTSVMPLTYETSFKVIAHFFSKGTLRVKY